MSDSIRGKDGYSSLKATREQDEIKRKIAEGWYVNDKGILVPPKQSKQNKMIGGKALDERGKDEIVSEKIAEADIKNRVTNEDDDIVKYATAEDIGDIKKVLLKILAVLDIIKESLKTKRHRTVSLTKKSYPRKRGGKHG